MINQKRMGAVMLVTALVAGFSAMSSALAFAGESKHGHVEKSHLHLAAVMPQSELQTTLRGLWKGHADAVYAVAKALTAKDDAAAAKAEANVVDNAKAIAAAIEPFYGAAAKDGLFELLAAHYGAVKAYTVGALAKDEAAKAAATKSATENGEKIAAFLAGANPNLPKKDVFDLLVGHVGHHFEQAEQLASGSMTDADATQTNMIEHLNVIADALAGALAKQFPEMVKA